MKFPWQKKSVVIDPSENNTAPQQGYSCKVYSLTETGPTRSANEDSIINVFPGYNQQTLFAMVADGMGGHNAGEVASRIACDSAKEFILAHYLQSDVNAMLEKMIQEMHSNIRRAAAGNDAYHGMGTTATSLFIREGLMYYAHVGDSRLYHYANNELRQCTTDHTFVNEMIRDGKITAEQAEHHDMKHVLIQALGTVDKIIPEISTRASAIHKGEYYILCSDGIHDAIGQQEMYSFLSMQQPALVLESVKALCYQRKAKDNFSLILVEITDEQPEVTSMVTREQNVML